MPKAVDKHKGKIEKKANQITMVNVAQAAIKIIRDSSIATSHDSIKETRGIAVIDQRTEIMQGAKGIKYTQS